MQWTLAFLETPPPAQQPRDQHLNDEARAEALGVLMRMLAQFIEVATQMDASDE